MFPAPFVLPAVPVSPSTSPMKRPAGDQAHSTDVKRRLNDAFEFRDDGPHKPRLTEDEQIAEAIRRSLSEAAADDDDIPIELLDELENPDSDIIEVAAPVPPPPTEEPSEHGDTTAYGLIGIVNHSGYYFDSGMSVNYQVLLI